jgi:hypothetical protein
MSHIQEGVAAHCFVSSGTGHQSNEGRRRRFVQQSPFYRIPKKWSGKVRGGIESDAVRNRHVVSDRGNDVQETHSRS